MKLIQRKNVVYSYIYIWSVHFLITVLYSSQVNGSTQLINYSLGGRPLDNLLVKDLHKVIILEDQIKKKPHNMDMGITGARRTLELLLKGNTQSEILRILTVINIIDENIYPIENIKTHTDLINRLFGIAEVLMGNNKEQIRKDIAVDISQTTNICLQVIVSNLIARHIFTILQIIPQRDTHLIDHYIFQSIKQQSSSMINHSFNSRRKKTGEDSILNFTTVYDELEVICCRRIRKAFSNLSLYELTQYVDQYLTMCHRYSGQEFCDYILQKDLKMQLFQAVSDRNNFMSIPIDPVEDMQMPVERKYVHSVSEDNIHFLQDDKVQFNKINAPVKTYNGDDYFSNHAISYEVDRRGVYSPQKDKNICWRNANGLRKGEYVDSEYLVPFSKNRKRTLSSYMKSRNRSNSESTITSSTHTYYSIDSPSFIAPDAPSTKLYPNAHSSWRDEEYCYSSYKTMPHEPPLLLPTKKKSKASKIINKISSAFSFIKGTDRSSRENSRSRTNTDHGNTSSKSKSPSDSKRLSTISSIKRSPSINRKNITSEHRDNADKWNGERSSTSSNDTIVIRPSASRRKGWIGERARIEIPEEKNLVNYPEVPTSSVNNLVTESNRPCLERSSTIKKSPHIIRKDIQQEKMHVQTSYNVSEANTYQPPKLTLTYDLLDTEHEQKLEEKKCLPTSLNQSDNGHAPSPKFSSPNKKESINSGQSSTRWLTHPINIKATESYPKPKKNPLIPEPSTKDSIVCHGKVSKGETISQKRSRLKPQESLDDPNYQEHKNYSDMHLHPRSALNNSLGFHSLDETSSSSTKNLADKDKNNYAHVDLDRVIKELLADINSIK
ncbi:hypothetical protein NEIRO03_1283 [Nematocida sp. AWRm78]|nr:hypothetical protein NEIRO02_0578 [Nematocida sp. AWRm79]KAI5183707.1 hypothetical protein NEIRO03_1283 [Nematocida sp. AWRm78]